jgi:hypothetical protein
MVYVSTPTDHAAGLTEFAFAPAGYCREVGCVQVYDVQAYKEVFPDNYFPPRGAATILRAQELGLGFQGGAGTRSIRMYGQNIFWANNEALVYDFQAYTDDEQYYVRITFPIDAPILLSTYDPEQNTNEGALPVPSPLPDPPERDSAIVEYNREAARQLDLLAAGDFAPALWVLDALVASVRVEPSP